MFRFPLAILLAVQSLLLVTVAARPWFVPTKVWSNTTTFQNSRRSFNYTALLESSKAREAVKHQPTRRSVNTTLIDLSPRSINITVPTTVHVARSLNFTESLNTTTVSLAASLPASNTTVSITRRAEPTKTEIKRGETKHDFLGRLLHIRRAIQVSRWANSTITPRSLNLTAPTNATRTVLPRSLSSSTVNVARSLPSGILHSPQSLSTSTSSQGRSVSSLTKVSNVRRSMKASHWMNSTST